MTDTEQVTNSAPLTPVSTTPGDIPTPPITPQQHSLPPIKTLFVESWHRMTSGALNALLVALTSLASTIALVVVFLMLMAGLVASNTNLSTIFEEMKDQGPVALKPLWESSGAALIILLVVLVVVLSVVSIGLTNATILAFADAENKPSFKSLLKKGFSKFLPVFITSFIIGFLAFGGLWFFAVPLMMISIFFGWAVLEVLLADKSPLAALRSSTNLVAQNFGGILGRVLLLWLTQAVISILLPAIFSSFGQAAESAYSIINVLISIPFGWYISSYGITLYKHAKAATTTEVSHGGLFWTMIVLSVVGWIIFALASAILFRLAAEYIQNKPAASYSKTNSQQVLVDTVDSTCGITVAIPATTSKDAPYRHWIYEERILANEAFRSLAPDSDIRHGVIAIFLAFKTDAERLTDENSKIGFPGYNLYCVDNNKNMDLAGFVQQAEALKDRKFTKSGEVETWGGITVQPGYIAGLQNGDYYKEPVYLGVTQGIDPKLFFIIPWDYNNGDADADAISSDMDTITTNFKYTVPALK